MSILPSAGYLSNAARLNSEMKTALESQLGVVSELPGGATTSTLTISSGTVTPTTGIHLIDTEAAAASDDLTNIAQTNHPDGRLLIIGSVSSARDVVVKHNAGGTGQITLVDGLDYTLDDPSQRLILVRSSTSWKELGRFYGSNTTAQQAFYGVSELIGSQSPSTLTIATDAITPTRAYHLIDTEAAAATDNLATISTANLDDGRFLILRTTNSARDVVLKHGTGNIFMYDSADLTMDSTARYVMFVRSSTVWNEVARFGFAFPGAGTVTSIQVAAGAGAAANIFDFSGGPVTTSGTITLDLDTQTANLGFMGPSSGSAAKPTFRTLVQDDTPYFNEILGAKPETQLTIASGSIAPTLAVHSVETESGAATDDLDFIGQSTLDDGRLLLLHCANASHVVTVRHNITGTGKIITKDALNIVLDATTKWVLLERVGTLWNEITRFNFTDSGGSSKNAFNGRLTPSSTKPIASVDSTSRVAGNIYLLPYKGNKARVWSASAGDWVERTIPNAGITIPLQNGQAFDFSKYDVFIYDNAGTLAVELLRWKTTTATNNLTPATNEFTINVTSSADFNAGQMITISGGGNAEVARVNSVGVGTVTVDRVRNSYTTPTLEYAKRAVDLTFDSDSGNYYKSTDQTRRYIGMICMGGNNNPNLGVGSNTFAHNENNRGIWNLYNQVPQLLLTLLASGSSHSYANTAWREFANAGLYTASASAMGESRVRAIVGIPDIQPPTMLFAKASVTSTSTAAVIACGIGLNSSLATGTPPQILTNRQVTGSRTQATASKDSDVDSFGTIDYQNIGSGLSGGPGITNDVGGIYDFTFLQRSTTATTTWQTTRSFGASPVDSDSVLWGYHWC